MQRKESRTVESYIILLIMLNCFGFPGNYEKLFGSSFATAIDYSCFFLETVLLITRAHDFIRVRRRDIRVYLYLFAIFITSMVVTRYPVEQAISCIRFAMTVCFALWIGNKYGLSTIVDNLCRAQAIFVVFTIIFMIVSPTNAYESTAAFSKALCGLYPTKNTCASELSLGIILMLLKLKKHSSVRDMWKYEKKNCFLILVQMYLLTKCFALGPIACGLIVSLYLVLWGDKRINPALVLIGGSVGFLVFAMTILPLLSNLLLRYGKDITLTGRTLVWQQILKVMCEDHTWTGYGFGMFWRDSNAYSLIRGAFDINSFNGASLSGAHNMLLEWWLNIGLIGILGLFYLIFKGMRRYKDVTREAYLFASGIIMFITIHGFSERAMGTNDYVTLLLFLAITVMQSNANFKEEKTIGIK